MEAKRFGFTKIEKFRAYDFHEWDHFPENLRQPMHTSMCGCSHSHAAICHLIAHYGWDRTLVLEDDFEILHDNFLERFEDSIVQVPSDWDLVYLGGGYGEPPAERVRENVVRAGYMKTTSSYGITASHARRMAPMIGGEHGPDDILSGYNPHVNAYILHPRLIGQYECMSDIWGKVSWNSQSMTDPIHDQVVSELKFIRGLTGEEPLKQPYK